MDDMPLELTHSWPLAECEARFSLHQDSPRGSGGVGRWSCDLVTGRIAWDPAIASMFGLSRAHGLVDRNDALACYEEGSRVSMERLRAHAIRHRRGFTLDVRITPADRSANCRWIRLSALARGNGGRATVLEGVKSDVTALYVR
jgi:PAS domain-containing protein